MQVINQTAGEFIYQFGHQLQDLKTHEFISSHQSKFFKQTKETLQPNEFAIVLDFSENFSFVIQDEIQAYHWSNAQCTVHPYCIYYRDGNGVLKNKSFIVLSESLEHNASIVYLFQTKLMSYLRQFFSNIAKIYFFSDGAASQYKNRYNFFNLCKMQTEYAVKMEWHFFATSHGKGPCDAIGGTFKRMATSASLQRPFFGHILTAKDLYQWHQKKKTTFHVEFCTKEESDKWSKKVHATYKNVQIVTGTQSYHCYMPVNATTIAVKKFSNSSTATNVDLIQAST